MKRMGPFLWAAGGFSSPYSDMAAPSLNDNMFRNRGNVNVVSSVGAQVHSEFEVDNVADPRMATAIVPLRLPWSSLVALGASVYFSFFLFSFLKNLTYGIRKIKNREALIA